MSAHLIRSRAVVYADLLQQVQAGHGLIELAQGDSGQKDLFRQTVPSWNKRNEVLLEQSFKGDSMMATTPSSTYGNFESLEALGRLHDPEVPLEAILNDVTVKSRRLSDIASQLDLYPEADGLVADESGEAPSGGPETIFIIHGRDDGKRMKLELFCHRHTKAVPVVLKDQTNSGRTVIEKLEDHLGSSASFAVVILSGDDEGRLRGSNETSPRARQNVVLELGYAMAALGRSRVVVLVEPGVEIPSDISGLVWVEMDDHDAWEKRLMQELQAAGVGTNI